MANEYNDIQNNQFFLWLACLPKTVMGQFDNADNLTPRTIWHHHKFYIFTIVWPRNMIRNILIATIYLFDWKLSCIMSLYQIRARQGPHIKTYLISWQLFGPKISLELGAVHKWRHHFWGVSRPPPWHHVIFRLPPPLHAWMVRFDPRQNSVCRGADDHLFSSAALSTYIWLGLIWPLKCIQY